MVNVDINGFSKAILTAVCCLLRLMAILSHHTGVKELAFPEFSEFSYLNLKYEHRLLHYFIILKAENTYHTRKMNIKINMLKYIK